MLHFRGARKMALARAQRGALLQFASLLLPDSSMSATGTIDVQGALTDLDSPEHLHLALAQVLPASSEDEASGYAKLKAYATQAADAGADVVAFPEYFLTGATHEEWYGVRDKGGPEPFQTQDADEGESHWVHDICTLARQLDVNIVAGTVVELGHHVPHRNDQPVSSDSLFNTAYFIGREGEVKGRYTKRVSLCKTCDETVMRLPSLIPPHGACRIFGTQSGNL